MRVCCVGVCLKAGITLGDGQEIKELMESSSSGSTCRILSRLGNTHTHTLTCTHTHTHTHRHTHTAAFTSEPPCWQRFTRLLMCDGCVHTCPGSTANRELRAHMHFVRLFCRSGCNSGESGGPPSVGSAALARPLMAAVPHRALY